MAPVLAVMMPGNSDVDVTLLGHCPPTLDNERPSEAKLVADPEFAWRHRLPALQAQPKYLQGEIYLYDDVGCITYGDTLTEDTPYYLERGSSELIQQNSQTIAEFANSDLTYIVELGCGSDSRIVDILRACSNRCQNVVYVPIDIGKEALIACEEGVRNALPHVRVEPMHSTYVDALGEVPTNGKNLFIWLGSTIANYPGDELMYYLSALRRAMKPDDVAFLEYDPRREDVHVHEQSYSRPLDQPWWTNIMNGVAKSFRTTIDVADFEYVPIWNDACGIEPWSGGVGHWLRANRHYVLEREGVTIKIEPGEMMLIMHSFKPHKHEMNHILSRHRFLELKTLTNSSGSMQMTVVCRDDVP